MGWVESANLNQVLYFIESAVLILCTWYFMEHSEIQAAASKKLRFIVFAVWGVIYEIVSAFLYPIDNTGLFLIVFVLAATILTGHFLYNNSRIYLFYYFLYPVSVYIMKLVVSYTVLSYNIARWGMVTYDYYSDNVAMITRILSLFLLTGMWILFLNRRKYEDVSKLQYAGLFLPPVFSIFIIFSLIIMGNVFMQMYGAFLIVLNIAFLVLMNLYILYLFSYLTKNQKLIRELEVLKSQREMQYHYYETIERKYQASRKMVHDIRNHLQSIESLLETGESKQAQSYADDMHQLLDSLGHRKYCQNRMLNIILNDKSEYARDMGVSMDIVIDNIPLEQIKDIDITTIFANLLDNAIEAAANAPEEKYIRMRAGTFHDFIVIKISNPTPCGSVHRSPDKNSGHMGLGLENVKMSLEKYGGGMEAKVTDCVYTVNLMIPVEAIHSDNTGRD